MEERIFGEIPGFPIGSTFKDRPDLSKSGVHRPGEAGICGGQNEGAESICMSGGYEDDEDYGDLIVYTGHGGLDRSTGKFIRNQELTRGNKALKINLEEQVPVRVVRGSKLGSEWAPKSGLRYDGLYYVTKFWEDKEGNGFRIFRYRLEGAPLIGIESSSEPDSPSRRPITQNRIVRNPSLAQKIKKLYDFKCQICGERLNSLKGPYAEAAHIKPLGAPHNGPDIEKNILCLCPNHHKLLDVGSIKINPDLQVINFEDKSIIGSLETVRRHSIGLEYLSWHWNEWNWN